MLLQTLANRDGESMWDTESMQMTERLIGVIEEPDEEES
jgi:hypothetical protein